MDKILITVHVPNIDNKYDFFVPINTKTLDVVNYIQDIIVEMSDSFYIKKDNPILVDFVSGKVINTNNVVKLSGLKHGSDVLLL